MILLEEKGTLKFPEIAYVWIFSETHTLSVRSGANGVPIILLEGPKSEQFLEIGDYLSSLNELWAKRTQSPLIQGRLENFESSQFAILKPNRHKEKALHDLSNQEVWRLAYNRDPYLRNLPEPDFLSAIGRVFSNLAVNFIIGKGKLTAERVRELTIGWIHGLEEAEHRRMDMRKLFPYIDREKVPEDLIEPLLYELSKVSWGRELNKAR